MCYNVSTVKERTETKMKNSAYKKDTYTKGYAFITKKTAHKKVRDEDKKSAVAD